jgi:hypothetical protein
VRATKRKPASGLTLKRRGCRVRTLTRKDAGSGPPEAAAGEPHLDGGIAPSGRQEPRKKRAG